MIAALLLGGLVGASAVVAVAGLRPAPASSWPLRVTLRVPLRPAAALVGAGAAGILSGWPVLAVAAAAALWWAPKPGAVRRSRRDRLERAEAVAAWTETLRDLVGAARGIEGAVVASVPVAPPAIAGEVGALAARLDRDPAAVVLAEFAAAVDDRTADLVAVVLRQAAEGQVRDVARLLGDLSRVAREEVARRRRDEAERARTRTSVRVVVVTTLATAGLLVVLNRRYFAVFGTGSGQLVLAAILAAATASLAWLARLGRSPSPEPVLMAGLDVAAPAQRLEPPAAAADLARALRVDRLATASVEDQRVVGLGAADLLARQGVGLVVGLAAGPALWVLARGAGAGLAVWVVAWVSGVGAIAGALLPPARVAAAARIRRRDFRSALVVFLDLVGLFLAAGRGIEGALDAASRAGAGWAFGEMADALHRARRAGESPWQGLDRLGTELGVLELREAARAALLAATEGARVRESLAAKASALRARSLAEAQEQAAASTERMAVPACLLLVCLVALITYPPVRAVMAGL
ncbi:MAG: type II secretion system F family protein [Actinomycetota bacterium]|nr:type II secretion system F family protein [Actinomycetota bacterium]